MTFLIKNPEKKLFQFNASCLSKKKSSVIFKEGLKDDKKVESTEHPGMSWLSIIYT